MDACIVTSGTGNAFPKDTGNSQTLEKGHDAAQKPTAPYRLPRRVFRGTLARPSSREIPVCSVAFAAKTLYVPASPRRYSAKVGRRNFDQLGVDLGAC